MADREMDLPLRIHSSRRLVDTPFMRVDEYRISYRRPDGSWSAIQTRINVDRGNSVAAILYDPKARLLHFVRQFRFSTYDFNDESNPDNGWLLELIAGSMKPGEVSRDCIIREVMEETGFQIENPEMIGSFYLTPGASSERLFLFYAEVSEERRAAPPPNDENAYGVGDEEIGTVTMSVSEFLAQVESMDICDAKTVAAAEYLRRMF